ncbi:MAG: hypothetical protein PVG13_09000 [Thiohalophilus sp.]|jgi:hypothetical protein
MGKMLENWRYASRLSRAVFVAVALLAILLWTLWQWPTPMVSRIFQQGQVVSVAQGGTVLVRLDSGTEVRLMATGRVLKAGDKVPLIVETYEDGSIRVYFNRIHD